MEPDILYLDNHLIVLNKPPGMLTQADRTGDPDLLNWVKQYLKEKFRKPGDVFVGMVQRLDRPVSGIVLFARTSKAAARLTAQFKEGIPRKKYLAVVEGHLTGGQTLQDYLVKENQRVRVVPADYPGAKYAELHWRSLAHQAGLTLLEVELKTGRPHQIRVQLAHRGTPIVGDFRYGATRELDGRNLALHCYFLEVLHPVGKEPLHWVVAPPATWGTLFRKEIEQLLRS